ncbi:MAG: TonB-dependent receptor, partial [Gammaproteobacteria bacterium]|nr:TonB-dependent receptor [Gammaproteobacteria bacterium]
MLNGHAVNGNFAVAAPHLMNLPIEQVERIEVIRGPGSVLYGEYAFSGVVNVITHVGENRGFVGFSRYNSPVVGGGFSHTLADEVELSINFSAKGSDGSAHNSGVDKGGDSGTLNTHREFMSTFLNLSIGETRLEAHYMENGKGDQFGLGDRLPPASEEVVVKDELLKLDLTHPFSLSETLSAEWQLDYSYGGFDMDDLYEARPGFLGLYAEGRVANIDYREERYDANLEFVWEELENNRLLFGLHYADVAIEDVSQQINYIPDQCINPLTLPAVNVVSCALLPAGAPVLQVPAPEQTYTGAQNLVKEDASRTISSLYLQNQYAFSEQLTVTLGGRLDHYSDMGDSTTPSLSVLYELDEENILKAQYAEAFRPPSFNELYTMNNPVVNGNLGLQGETIQTWEVSHIHKERDRSLRTTLFYSSFENLIHKDGVTSQYENSGAGWHRGVELEAEQVINSDWKLDGNLSWIETEDEEDSHALEGAPDWLANLNLTWQPTRGETYTAHLRHVGDRNRDVADPRPDLEGFQTVDLSGNWEDLFSTEMTLRAGVRNLLDDEVVYPAAASTYLADYPQQGRTWWLRLSRRF